MPRRYRPLLLVLLGLLATLPLTLSRAQSDGGRRIAPGTTGKILLAERVVGFRRSFRLHVPEGWVDGEARPLVVALHGALATARILEKQSGFSDVADRYGFFVAYPNGLGLGPLFRHWNGGYCCGRALRTDLDDVGFIDRVIEQVVARYPIDREKIYVIGYSNGGMLAYIYAAEHAERLAGLGIWASTLGSLERPERSFSPPRPAAPLPAVIAHAFDDPRLPFAGPMEEDDVRLLGAEGSAAFWAAANGCREGPRSQRSHDGAVEERVWCGDSANPVVLLGIEAWDHDWPGPKRTAKLEPSDPLHGFDLAEELWRAFESFRPADTPHDVSSRRSPGL